MPSDEEYEDEKYELCDLAEEEEFQIGNLRSFELWPPSRKHDIAKVIRRHRFNISDFTWRAERLGRVPESRYGYVIEAAIVPALVHKPTGFYFAFDLRKKYRPRAVMSPCRSSSGLRRRGDAIQPEWEDLLDCPFADWLTLVRSEGKPDPWAQIAHQPDLSHPPDSATDEPFTPEEQKRIEAVLGQLRDHLTQQMADATEEQKGRLGRLEEAIAYLKQEARTQSKRAWYFMFVGAMVTVSAQLLLQPDQVKALLQMLGTAVNQIFGGPALLQ